MSEKVKNILENTNIVLLILCIIMFFVSIYRVTTFVGKIDTYNDSSEKSIVKVIEKNNEPKIVE